MYNLRTGSLTEKVEALETDAKTFIETFTTNKKLQNVLEGSNLLYAGEAEKTSFYVHVLVVISYIESSYKFLDGGSQIGKPETVVPLGPDLFALLHSLRERGVRLALDDFGQGQTSLRYLRDLPLDVLKIDKAFIDGLDGEPEDEAIVTAIVGLAHRLGIRVIAEGVEREEQLRILRSISTDFVQGYLLHRPKEADAMAALLGVTPLPARAAVSAGVQA